MGPAERQTQSTATALEVKMTEGGNLLKKSTGKIQLWVHKAESGRIRIPKHVETGG